MLDVVVPATLVGLVGVGLGILLGRTVLAPKQSAATPAPTRVNPGGGLKDVGWANNVIDAPGLDRAAILTNDDCWQTLFRLSPSQRGQIVWAFVRDQDHSGGLMKIGQDQLTGLSDQMEALRAQAYAQTCSGLWPSEGDVRSALAALRALLVPGSALEQALCSKVTDFAKGRGANLFDFDFQCGEMPTAAPVEPTPMPTLSPSACWSAFQSFTVAQQGWVAAEMLRRFGLSGYVQVGGDAALGARLRAISQAAQAKVGSAALQPKFVNERLRALQVALRAVGQDRRDEFCRLVASEAPYAAPPVPTSSPAWPTKSPMDRPVPTSSPAHK